MNALSGNSFCNDKAFTKYASRHERSVCHVLRSGPAGHPLRNDPFFFNLLDKPSVERGKSGSTFRLWDNIMNVGNSGSVPRHTAGVSEEKRTDQMCWTGSSRTYRCEEAKQDGMARDFYLKSANLDGHGLDNWLEEERQYME